MVSKCTHSTCRKCGQPATKRNGYGTKILVQHTKILERKVYLRIKPVKYECKECDDHPTTTEQYGWCGQNTKITKALEKYLMLCLINSTLEDVSRKERVSDKTIMRAVSRQVNNKVDWSQYTDLAPLQSLAGV
ncbi:helix-turn-helix domain-containing protein [Shewanella surugensis]|uniref:Transposase family protein n=1 Tax=Shewanella surugensis TaxID=212020 RepID=A0ABT0LJH7_9GAMM|nr:helix-turn-helix domain-containing protein [Shewanella surugensis]MCL1127820.1 transposase family protein [Shewanella surugensis]